MKKELLLLFVMIISCVNNLFAQTYIVDSSTVNYASIARNVTGTQFVYAKTGDASGYFMRGIVATGQVLTPVKVLDGYNVTDFTLLNDTLYVTGADSNGIGFYGWAKATTSMVTPWIFTMYRLQTSVFKHAKSISRIKVFREGGNLHVLLVGVYQNLMSTTSCVIDVKNNSTWTIGYSGVENFDDVELTDDYVALVARKGTSDSLHRPLYTRIAPKLGFTLTATQLATYYSVPNAVEACGAAHLQQVGANKFVTVFCNGNSQYIYTNLISGNQMYTPRRYGFITSANPVVRDLTYNASTSTLLVEQSNDLASDVAMLSCSAYPTLTIDCMQPNEINNEDVLLRSVSYNPSWGFYITGCCQNKLAIWRMQNADCVSQFICNMSYVLCSATSASNALGTAAFSITSSVISTKSTTTRMIGAIEECPLF